jgi:hypothetical protein
VQPYLGLSLARMVTGQEPCGEGSVALNEATLGVYYEDLIRTVQDITPDEDRAESAKRTRDCRGYLSTARPTRKAELG